MTAYETRQVVIFVKTYPELSTRHTETVCTGALDATTGLPVRLYPVPLRYLDNNAAYRLYDRIDVPARKSDSDFRPESFKINASKIRRLGRINSADHWRERRDLVFRSSDWHFNTMEELKAANKATELSIGCVKPGQIVDVQCSRKPPQEREAYHRKSAELRAMKESDLFDSTYKELEYLPNHIRLLWRCEGSCPGCKKKPHRMKVLDWGLLELGRLKGWPKAVQKLEEISDARAYDFRLFLGNFRLHPRNFGIIGLWYPKIPIQQSLL